MNKSIQGFFSVLMIMTFTVYASETPTQAPQIQTEEKQVSLFEKPFATVGNTTISQAEFREYAYQQNRSRFYHGKPPELEEFSYYKGLGDDLVSAYLLAEEAKKIKIPVDQNKIEEQVAAYDGQFDGNKQWEVAREFFLPMYQRLLETTELAKKYEQYVKERVVLTEQHVQDFHQSNIDKFIQPPQNRVAVILIGVDPSARGFVWKVAREQAEAIHEKLVAGEEFATLAELHSSDVTADQGGDMGFVHKGMIAADVEKVMEDMTIGEFTKPIVLLDGVSIFKLLDRKPSIVHTFDEVRERATSLATTAAKEAAWSAELAKVTQQAKISIDESTFSL